MLDNNLGLSQKYEIHQPGQWLILYSLTQWVEASLLEFPLVQINKYKGTFHPKTKSNFLLLPVVHFIHSERFGVCVNYLH